MKSKYILVVMTIGLFSAMPVFASQINTKISHGDSRPCAKQAESLQEKIHRLETEITKGEKTLDAKELKKLEEELNEAKTSLKQLNKR